MGPYWCSRCRTARPIEWAPDTAFGPRAESARCPWCGTVWGVRERRRGPFEQAVQQRMEGVRAARAAGALPPSDLGPVTTP